MDSVVICRNSEEEKNSISVKNMDLRDASASRNTKAGRGNRGNFQFCQFIHSCQTFCPMLKNLTIPLESQNTLGSQNNPGVSKMLSEVIGNVGTICTVDTIDTVDNIDMVDTVDILGTVETLDTLNS